LPSFVRYYFESFNLFIVLYVIFSGPFAGLCFTRISKVFCPAIAGLSSAPLCWTLLILPEQSYCPAETQNERIILVIFGGACGREWQRLWPSRIRGSTGDEDIHWCLILRPPTPQASWIDSAVIRLVGSTPSGDC